MAAEDRSAAEEVRQVASLVIRPRRTLAKAQSPNPFDEVGSTGLRQFGGFVLEEWLQALAGRRAAWVWREMKDNDPTVGAILFAVNWLAQAAEWRVEEGADSEAAELVETSMHDMSHTWGDFVSECLSFLPYGWSFHEQVFKRCDGYKPPAEYDPAAQGSQYPGVGSPDSNPASSAYSDGKIRWRKLPVRAQETLLRWHFDGVSGLRAMEQVDWHGGDHIIPISKGLLFRTQTTRANPEGRSILRNAYTSYFAIKNIRQVEAIGIERDLAGIPVATPPEGVDLFAPANTALLTRVQELVTSIRRDEYDGVVLPTAGWKLELLKAAGARQVDTDAVVRRYRQDIAASMLADWVLIGMDAVGSYAMVDVKSDLFGLALDGILDLICEVMNRYAIPKLLLLNGMSVEDPPRIAHGSAGRLNLEKVGQFLNSLYLAGAPIPWSIELLKSLFLEAGLPANFEEQEAPDGSDIWLPASVERTPAAKPSPEAQQAADAAEEADGTQNAAAQRQQPAQPLTKAEARTGAMVALYPSADVAGALAQDGGEPAGELHVTLAYLGDAAALANPDELRQAVALWAARTPPLEGEVSGTGTFTAGPQPVTYASADVPGLPEHRQRLVEQLARAGAPASGKHGFTPHITLAYDARTPDVENHALRFDHATLRLGSKRHDFPLAGVKRAGLAKAEHETVPQGTVIAVGPHLQQRAQHLSVQLESEMRAALAELGEHAATAYLTVAQKATAGSLHRTVARVMAALNIRQWMRTRLAPIMQNHAGRVAADTQRTLQAEIGLEVGLAEDKAKQLADSAGEGLGLRDIESQVRAAIIQAVKDGFAAGDNPTRTAARIRTMVPAGRFVTAGSPYRARLIARDQTARLQRAATLAIYESNPRIESVRLRDGIYGPPRSDSDCMDRSGEIVPKAEARGVHALHPLCVAEGTEVVPVGELRAVTRAVWSGRAVRLGTAEGHRLTVGPNHPVLTARGWVKADALREGDHVVRCAGGRHELDASLGPVAPGRLHAPHVDDAPAKIEQIFEALRELHGTTRLVASGDDLHGDGNGVEGEIEVVGADGPLPAIRPASNVQERGKRVLVGAGIRDAHLPGSRSPDLLLDGNRHAPTGLVSGVRGTRTDRDPALQECSVHGAVAEPPAVPNLCESHAVCVCAGGLDGHDGAQPPRTECARILGASQDAGFEEQLAHHSEAATDVAGELVAALPGLIAFDEIVDLSLVELAGAHVYDLSTSSGAYVAGGLIVHNCTLGYEPVVVGRLPAPIPAPLPAPVPALAA